MRYARKIVLRLPLSNLAALPQFIEACLRDRVSLIAIGGTGSGEVENIIDRIIVGDGSDKTRFIATTSHDPRKMRWVSQSSGGTLMKMTRKTLNL